MLGVVGLAPGGSYPKILDNCFRSLHAAPPLAATKVRYSAAEGLTTADTCATLLVRAKRRLLSIVYSSLFIPAAVTGVLVVTA